MLFKFTAIAGCLIAYMVLTRILSSLIRRFGREHRSAEYRILYVEKTAKIALATVTTLLICVLLGIGYGQIHLFLSSVFAVIGIALFAQWSILSNITASLIIFFSFPYRIDDEIEILEGDKVACRGKIDQITLFHVIIKDQLGNAITYPNSLILQKPVVKIKTKKGNSELLNDG